MPTGSTLSAWAIHLSLAALLTLPLAGCLTSVAGDIEPKPVSETDQPIERTPDDLIEALEKAQAKAGQIARALQSCASEVAERRLREQVDEGLAAADELLGHADAEQPHIEAAHKAMAGLLYHGMRFRWDGFQQRLSALHEQLAAGQPNSPLVPVVEAMLLEQKCLDPQAEFNQVIAALEGHARRHPNQPTGLALYRLYADHLKKQRRMQELQQCCTTALRAYGNRPETRSFRDTLAGIETKVRKERANTARLEGIRSRLAGHRTGYFVIYAHPPQVGYMTRVDYHVARGLEGVDSYTSAMDEDWVWELKGRFPDTEDGNQQAFALRKKLLDENTITMFGF